MIGVIMPIPPLEASDEAEVTIQWVIGKINNAIKEILTFIIGLVLLASGYTGAVLNTLFWPFEQVFRYLGWSVNEVVDTILDIPIQIVEIVGRPAHEIAGTMGPISPIFVLMYYALLVLIVVRTFEVATGVIR